MRNPTQDLTRRRPGHVVIALLAALVVMALAPALSQAAPPGAPATGINQVISGSEGKATLLSEAPLTASMNSTAETTLSATASTSTALSRAAPASATGRIIPIEGILLIALMAIALIGYAYKAKRSRDQAPTDRRSLGMAFSSPRTTPLRN